MQLKVIWGVWRFRDLPFGDTGSYYDMAGLWRGLRVNALWSPLYTAFFGTFRLVFRDAYAATIAHRVAILLVVAALVLAVARRLLPEPFAWGVAAWWVVLPIHFDALYEVHLFAVVPPLLGALAALALPGRRGRALCFAILVAGALLVRNELAVAALLYALACARIERRERGGPRALAAYALPAAVALGAALLFCSRSVVKGREALAALEAKHVISTCQPYAFGWKQRHPEWKGDPWTGCGALMAEHFGEPSPTLARMLARAPGRVAEHVAWNLRLAPGGLQLLAFNVASGSASPDYSEHPPKHPAAAWVATLLLLAAASMGLVAARREREAILEPAALPGWIALACGAAPALLVIPTQRPRPAYLFFAGIALAALAARLLQLALARTALAARLARLGAAAMVAAPVLAPPYFLFGRHRDEARPLLHAVRRIAPFRDLVSRPGNVTVACGASWELEGYVDAGFGAGHRVVPLESACPPASTPDLGACAAGAGGTLVYVNETCAAALPATAANLALLDAPGSVGWKRLAPAPDSREAWRLLVPAR